MDAPCLVTDPAQTEHRIERDELETIPALLALQSHTITDASADDGTLQGSFR